MALHGRRPLRHLRLAHVVRHPCRPLGRLRSCLQNHRLLPLRFPYFLRWTDVLEVQLSLRGLCPMTRHRNRLCGLYARPWLEEYGFHRPADGHAGWGGLLERRIREETWASILSIDSKSTRL